MVYPYLPTIRLPLLPSRRRHLQVYMMSPNTILHRMLRLGAQHLTARRSVPLSRTTQVLLLRTRILSVSPALCSCSSARPSLSK
jgi:hypothetical protein